LIIPTWCGCTNGEKPEVISIWHGTDRRVESILHGIEHTQDIVHRNLKPENILVDFEDRLRIMDFGMARLTGTTGQSLTATGEQIGTPFYMSPEQCRGDKPRIGPWSDLFSIGVILYELITEVRPFQGRNAFEIQQAIVEMPTPSLREQNPQLPKSLDALCLRALAKKPEDRFPSAGDMSAALRKLLDSKI
jgi:serine/threonine-protein kinase